MNTHRLPGIVLKELSWKVPLDHNNYDSDEITVFAREAVAPENESKDMPWLLFLQGGPGFGSPRPDSSNGWLKRALAEYRVLLLDQRGTGRSSPVLPQTLEKFPSPEEQANYLKNFRADSIIKDAEIIRRSLPSESRTWSVLGQSYGGFCAVHYLSAYPESLKEVIITGGLPPLTQHPDNVYRATYQTVLAKNKQFYTRYPDDVQLVQNIVKQLQKEEVQLPAGGILTPRRFQQLGISFGASNGFEIVHYLLESAFVGGEIGKELNNNFLRAIENALSFETNPIFSILHESIYCQGFASNWSADRILKEYPDFKITPGNPIYFTGEMIYPWMFDDYPQLKPLKAASDLLASYTGWPDLYNLDVLNNNSVPCVAAVYYDDMYVDREISLSTAKEINGLQYWITNEHHHSALRLHGEKLLDRLIRMVRE